MDISGNDLKVLCFFIKFNNFMKEMYFSIQYIATKTKLSKRCVQSCLASLRNKNVITWTQRENKTNIYKLNLNGKSCQEVNTNNLLNNTIAKNTGDKVKYVRTEIISREIKQVTKRTNIFYKSKVNQNNQLTNRQRLEKYAWKFIAEMESDKRHALMNKLTDPVEWEKFLEKMKSVVVYQRGRKINK